MWFFVGFGGAIGALTRYGVSLLFSSINLFHFPIATFFVNILGSFLFGAMIGYTKYSITNRKLYTGITAGFLGSFTTFSTFSTETVQLMEDGQIWLAIFYVISSVALGWMLAFYGTKLGTRMNCNRKGLK